MREDLPSGYGEQQPVSILRRGLGCADALKTRGSADGKAVQWMKAVQWKADLNELREAMIQWLERALKQWQYSAG